MILKAASSRQIVWVICKIQVNQACNHMLILGEISDCSLVWTFVLCSCSVLKVSVCRRPARCASRRTKADNDYEMLDIGDLTGAPCPIVEHGCFERLVSNLVTEIQHKAAWSAQGES